MGIESTVKLGPVNNFLHALFSQVNINITNQNVGISNSSYSIRSYLENLISFNKVEKPSILAGDCFEKETCGEFDNFTIVPSNVNTTSKEVLKVFCDFWPKIPYKSLLNTYFFPNMIIMSRAIK
jgi:hypothetical protein